jgi:hypothetical protein
MYNTGVNPNVYYGLWVTIMWHYKFIDGNKYTPWLRGTDKGRGLGDGSQGYMGTLSTFFYTYLSCDLKLL